MEFLNALLECFFDCRHNIPFPDEYWINKKAEICEKEKPEPDGIIYQGIVKSQCDNYEKKNPGDIPHQEQTQVFNIKLPAPFLPFNPAPFEAFEEAYNEKGNYQ